MFKIVGFVLGALVGVPVSYCFQSDVVRALMGVGDYMGKILKGKGNAGDVGMIIGSSLVCALVLAGIGAVMDKHFAKSATE